MTDTSGPVHSAALVSYRAAVYAACERALDEGLFYESVPDAVASTAQSAACVYCAPFSRTPGK